MTFTVDDVSLSGYAYDAGANHDPDGDSDGTVIDLAKPERSIREDRRSAGPHPMQT